MAGEINEPVSHLSSGQKNSSSNCDGIGLAKTAQSLQDVLISVILPRTRLCSRRWQHPSPCPFTIEAQGDVQRLDVPTLAFESVPILTLVQSEVNIRRCSQCRRAP